MIKTKWFLIALLLIAFAVVACSPSAADPTVAPEPEITAEAATPAPVLDVVRYVNFKVYDPIYVAIENGYFLDEGIDLQMAGDTLAGPTAIQAVSSGKAEAGLSSIAALINANVAGLPVQGVVDIQTTLDGQPLQKWYVREDSPYQTLADVAGATYAVNLWYSSFHYTTLMGLETEGVSPDDVNFVLLPFTEQITALQNGTVDVIGLIPPHQGYAEALDGLNIRELWNDYDLYGSRHVSLIFVNRVWADNNPDVATRFVSAVTRAINWTEENPTEAADIVEKYTGVNSDLIPAYHFAPNGEVRPDDIVFWMDWLSESQGVALEWLSSEDVGTNKYSAD